MNSNKFINRMPTSLFSLVLGVLATLLGILFTSIQRWYVCSTNNPCLFYGSLVWFIVFNALCYLIIGFGLKIYAKNNKTTSSLAILLIFSIIFGLYVYGTINAFRTYALILPDRLILNNHLKLTINPAVVKGRYTLYAKDMKSIERTWHLRGSNNPLFCTVKHTNLLMKDGAIYSLNDYGTGSLINKLSAMANIKILDKNYGTLNCVHQN